MVKQKVRVRVTGSVLPELASLVEGHWTVGRDPAAKARAICVGIKKVAHEGNAIKLRIARVLECANKQDVREGGYARWSAFAKEYSPWSPAQERVWRRVARCRLRVVVEALLDSEIHLATATHAVQTLDAAASPEVQRVFLRDLKGEPRRRRGASEEVVEGTDAECVREARRLGAVLMGGDPSVSLVDEFLIDCHARKRTCKDILDTAHEPPPVPDRVGNVVSDWPEDPAEGLLGPWVPPADVHESMAQLRELEQLLAERRVFLAVAYDLVRRYRLWTELPDCESLEELCVAYLGMSQRTFQRYAEEGLRHNWYPEIRKEILAGRLTIDRANVALERGGVTGDSIQSWVEVVRQLGRTELQHTIGEYGDADLRDLYAPEIAFADEVREQLVAVGETTGTSADLAVELTEARATGTSATASRVASYLRHVGATGTVQIALRDGRHAPTPPREVSLLVPPKLLEAAKYVLSVVKLPPTYGVRRAVARDRYTCQNPRCRQRTLRIHPHHIQQRQHGGSDLPRNLVSLCFACHLGGVHSGRMAVVRFDDFLVWTWSSDDTAVLMYAPEDEEVIAAAA